MKATYAPDEPVIEMSHPAACELQRLQLGRRLAERCRACEVPQDNLRAQSLTR